ncbi:hypothetical protein Fbal_1900 [Ferrimonas balearica DSM 9799]|uniref:Uncharacterized protein n=2 Tax=Ferrimonas balearica TaxID=44012 RepID=E1ST56_FERBD|nr:hypothetical protein Fbal_1900 [Ferrimonas balearica DSM 9799]
MSVMGLRFNLLAQRAADKGYGIKVNQHHPERYDLYALSDHSHDHSVYDISYEALLEELQEIEEEDS